MQVFCAGPEPCPLCPRCDSKEQEMKNRVLRKSVVILLVCMVLFTAAGCMTTENRYDPDGTPYTETRVDPLKTSGAILVGIIVLFRIAMQGRGIFG